jgi:hypothetical protein
MRSEIKIIEQSQYVLTYSLLITHEISIWETVSLQRTEEQS